MSPSLDRLYHVLWMRLIGERDGIKIKGRERERVEIKAHHFHQNAVLWGENQRRGCSFKLMGT